LNAVASGLDYGTRVVVELVVSPLVVAGLGAQAYGAWRVLWQWSNYVWGASGRSAQALQYAIANRQWTASSLEKRQLVGSALVVWVLFLPLMLVVGAVGVWFGPDLLDVPVEQVTAVRVAAAILMVDAMAVTLVTLPRSALQGENLGYTRMGISAVLVAVGGVLMALAVVNDLGLPGLAAATVVTTLLTGWVFWLVSRRRLPWFGASRPPRTTVRWFLGLSAWFLGWKFVLELMIASDILVLAAFSSLTVVAAFALSKWVADSLAQGLALLVQATIPGIGAYLGSGDLRKAAALRGEVVSLVWLVGTAAGSAIIVWNGTFVRLWVGEGLFAGNLTTLLVVVLAFQIALIRTDTFTIDVALVPRVKVVAGVIAAVASIVLAAVGVGPLDGGVTGLCLGLVLGRAILGVAAPVAVGRVLGVRVRRQLSALLRPAVVTAAVFAAGSWLAEKNPVSSWLGLVAGVATTVLAVTLLAAFSGLSRRQRAQLVGRVRSMGRRPRGGRA
jgi:O-antigen/teichoic acid export membrane protein